VTNIDASNDNVYDVIIVGGGPAGASTAIHLAAHGARVLLAEQKKFPRPKLCGEFISPECVAHFARLGVVEQMLAAGGVEVAETVFYTRGGQSVNVPSAWLGGTHRRVALGLSRATMDERLLSRARDVGVTVLEESPCCGLIIEQESVRGVRLKAAGVERACRARVTVDATGRSRALARRIITAAAPHGERREHRTTRARPSLVAFKTHLENTRGDQGACEIYFYRGGYGGLSEVEGGRSNLCFIAAARDVRARGGDAARVMREVVMSNKRAARTLGEARVCAEWLCVALETFGRGEAVPQTGLLAVGDAASFIDPFTGSGMLMALESGELVAEVIARHLSSARRSMDSTSLADEYRARYEERFGARLRVCAWLRRAAFAPPVLSGAAASLLNASAGVRRVLARATRRGGGEALARQRT